MEALQCSSRWEELRDSVWVGWLLLFGPADPSISPHTAQTKSRASLISAWPRLCPNAPHACSRHWHVMCFHLSASLPEVLGEGGCVQGAGGGPRRGAHSGKPRNCLCAAAAEEPGGPLAAHHRRNHDDGLPALRPQRGKMQPPVRLSRPSTQRWLVIKKIVNGLIGWLIRIMLNY